MGLPKTELLPGEHLSQELEMGELEIYDKDIIIAQGHKNKIK